MNDALFMNSGVSMYALHAPDMLWAAAVASDVKYSKS